MLIIITTFCFYGCEDTQSPQNNYSTLQELYDNIGSGEIYQIYCKNEQGAMFLYLLDLGDTTKITTNNTITYNIYKTNCNDCSNENRITFINKITGIDTLLYRRGQAGDSVLIASPKELESCGMHEINLLISYNEGYTPIIRKPEED